MTREEIYTECLTKLEKSDFLLLELATGMGKSKQAIDIINYLVKTKYQGKHTSMLLLVAKTVHKQTWKDEFKKWGGINVDDLTIECYESLKKHEYESFDFVVMDECFRGDTEILTNEGYKRFDALNGTEKVAQFTKEGNIEFVKPIRFIQKDYNGNLCKVYLGKNRHVYLTPNHNQVYKTMAIDEWRLKPIKDLKGSHFTKIPVAGKGTGNNTPLSPIEQLYVAIQADGTLQRHQKNESVYSIQITRERKKQRLASILSNIDSSLWTKIKGRGETDRYMIKLPKGDAKLLSTHFDINMGYDRAKSFIDEILEWDGHKESFYYYSSCVKENSDFVSAIAVQAGYKALVSVEKDNRKESHKDIFRVFMQKCSEKDTQSMKKDYMDYDGKVYCVEVPSHMIVVRSEGYTFISGNCHHLHSDKRLDLFSTLTYGHVIGLSATIPKKLKQYFQYEYAAEVVTCSIVDAIEDEVLPEPQIILYPLQLDNVHPTESIELNPKVKGKTYYGNYNELWKYRKMKVHAIISCTPRQRVNEYNSQILYEKNRYMRTRQDFLKNKWLFDCGERIKYLANLKNNIVLSILQRLEKERTITFCKTIEQADILGNYSIHSKNKDSDIIYNNFNAKKINHIVSVNVLNEGANLVDCKYAVFANYSSSEICSAQRVGRSLRHKSPVIILPYYEATREEEIVNTMIESFKEESIHRIHSLKELDMFIQ